MIDFDDLSADECAMLLAALDSPLVDRSPASLSICLRLCGWRLLQRAGTASAANGWEGSPHAFVLTREGWGFVRAARQRRPMRRTG
ncbi:MAG: hypothetical protein E7812_13530 [Phenylobacterium sp.]|nr:MAG: hypothetical protein E7812_13530 [Phenylobacterium sp.]